MHLNCCLNLDLPVQIYQAPIAQELVSFITITYLVWKGAGPVRNVPRVVIKAYAKMTISGSFVTETIPFYTRFWSVNGTEMKLFT